MTILNGGIHNLKSSVRIQAPVEICYQAWLETPRFPNFMSRVVSVECKPKDFVTSASMEEVQSKSQLFKQNVVPSLINHWLLSGPGGNLYEASNTVILEIPNHFYCTTSIDPDDLSIQSSLFFIPDQVNQNTILEWQISFWISARNGKSTKLASDILQTGDAFLENSLQDFKAHVEAS